MLRSKLSILFSLLTSFISIGYAQSIVWGTITPQSPATICGDSSILSIDFIAAGGGFSNGKIEIRLPSNVEYANAFSFTRTGLGTVTWDNTSAPSRPTFIFGSATNGENFNITLYRKMLCGAPSTTVDSIYIYNNGIQIGARRLSPVYNIQSATLSVVGMSNIPATATVGANVTRTVRITNQDFGYLKSFSFIDKYDANSLTVDVNSFVINPSGSNFVIPSSYISLPSTNDSIVVQFDTILIQQMGNFNNKFEKNEFFDLSYNVIPLNCGSGGTGSISSTLYSYWGCATSNCQFGSSNFNLPINISGIPSIALRAQAPNKICLQGPNGYAVQVINNGTGSATNVLVNLTSPNVARLYIDTASIQYQVGINGTLVHQNISNIITKNSSDFSLANNCDFNGKPSGFTLTIPAIASSDTVFIYYNQFNCAYDYCPSPTSNYAGNFQGFGGISLNTSYKDVCESNNYSISSNNILEIIYTFQNSNAFPTDIFAGETKEFTTIVTNENLWGGGLKLAQSTNAYYEISLDLPAGIEFDNSGGDGFRWYKADRSTFWGGVTIVTNTLSNVVVRVPMIGAWPGANTSNSEIVFKLKGIDYSGSGGSCGNKLIRQKIALFPDADNVCGSNAFLNLSCIDKNVNLHCTSVSCVGINFVDFASERTNYGLPDNDNDGFPDAAGSINLSSIKKDRLTYLDTLTNMFKGVVKTDIANPVFEYVYGKYFINNLSFYFNLISTDVTIKRASGGATITGTIAALIVGDTAFFDVSALGGNVFNDGDSIFISNRLQVKTNIGSAINTLSAGADFYASHVSNPNSSQKFSCDNFGASITILGYYTVGFYVGGDNVAQVLSFNQGCQDKTFGIGYYFGVGSCCSNYGGGNIFPFEVRRLGAIDSATITVPNGYKIISSTVEHTITNGSGISLSENAGVLAPANSNGQSYTFNISTLYNQNGGSPLNMGDDGWVMRHGVVIRPTGNSLIGTDEFLDVKAYLNNGMTINTNTHFKVNYTGPILDLTTSAQNLNGYSNFITWTANAQNTHPSIAAPNSWAYISNASSGVVVSNVIDGTTILTADANGFYQLGAINPNSIKNLKITADYNLCGKDSIKIYIGYGCDNYPSNIAAAFIKDSLVLYIQPTAAGVSVNIVPLINTPTDPSDGTSAAYGSSSVFMCNDFPVQLEVNSTQPSTIYNVFSLLELPTNTFGSSGIDFVGGSGYIEYPIGTAPRPFSVTSNGTLAISGQTTLTLDLSQIDPVNFGTNQGLKGSLNPDSNKVILRFNLRSNCDLFSGTVFKAKGKAKAPCGSNAIGDGITTSSTPLFLNGITASNGIDVNLSMSSTTFTSCAPNRTGTLTLTKFGVNPVNANDSIFIILPAAIDVAGITWVSGVGAQPVAISDLIVGTNRIVSWQFPLQYNLLASNGNGQNSIYLINFSLNSSTNTSSTGSVKVQVLEKINISCNSVPCPNAAALIGEVEVNPIRISFALIGLAKEVTDVHQNADSTYSVTYRMIAKNYSGDDLYNVQIVDTLTNTFISPATYTVTNYSATGGFATAAGYNGNTNSSFFNPALSNLASGDSDTLTVTIRVNPNDFWGPYNNSAFITAQDITGCSFSDQSTLGSDPDPNGNGYPSDTLEDVVTPIYFNSPVVGISKSVGLPSLQANQSYNVTYTIKVKNLGNVLINNLQVIDSLINTFPAPTTYSVVTINATGSLSINGLFDGSNNTLLLDSTSSTLAVGDSSIISITVNIVPNGVFGTFYNSAFAIGKGSNGLSSTGTTIDTSTDGANPDPNGNGNPNDLGENISTPLNLTPNSSIGVAKSASSPLLQPDGTYNVTYTIIVGNYGNDTLYNLQVIDDLESTFPAPTSYSVTSGPTVLGTSISANNNFDGNSDSTLLNSNISLLAPLHFDTIVFTVNISPNGSFGPFSNSAIARGLGQGNIAVSDTSMNGNNPDANNNGNPNDDKQTTDINLTPTTSIGAAKSVGMPEKLSNTSFNVTYTITLKNYGNEVISNVQVIENLVNTFPAPTTFSLVAVPIVSSGLAVNSSFNGSTDINLLASGSTLNVGQTSTIVFSVVVYVPIGSYTYYNTAIASGIGITSNTAVSDSSSDGNDPDLNGNNNPSDNGEAEPTPITLEGIDVDFFMPSGFSPNGDGTNDLLVINGINKYPENNLKIFNRWGNLIYEANNYQNNWDGLPNINGIIVGNEKVPNGTYYYILDLGTKDKPLSGYLIIKY